MRFRSIKFLFAGLFVSMLISVLCRADLAVTELWPTNLSTAVCADTPLRIAFNEPVILGGKGKIAVYRATDNKLVDTFDLDASGFTNNFGGICKIILDLAHSLDEFECFAINSFRATFLTSSSSIGTKQSPEFRRHNGF